MKLSIYKNIHDAASRDTIDFELFIDAVKTGKWQDKVLPIRVIKDHDERQRAKKNMPYVTISGIFNEKRAASALSLHSGLLAMDVDNLSNELEGVKSILSTDQYVHCCFTSVSGTGLCVIFKINGERHLDAFNGIADYLIKQYQIIIDPSGKDVSRPRYVSFDPYLYYNEKSLVFKKYLPKEKKRKTNSVIFVKDEFDEVLKKMCDQNVSCVDDYRDWLAIGFGLAGHFGEAGRHYFHSLSSISPKYESSMCDRQYTHCLKGNNRGAGKITIATIYWFAKQAGIKTSSATTTRIAAATSSMKASGLDAKAISNTLQKIEGITGVDDIIQQAFESSKDFSCDGNLYDNVVLWLKTNHNIKRNLVTRMIETDCKDLDEIDVNSLFFDCQKIFEDLKFEYFLRILTSHAITSFNPFIEFLKENENTVYSNEINRLLGSIATDQPERLIKYGTKWLVSMMASIHGSHSPLMLVLCGSQGTGKTEFFRRLLPKELTKYYAESCLDDDKDADILMTKKLIIMDDEMDGKNKKESKRLKSLTSKQTFSIREPYGRISKDLQRMALLCGTGNELGVIEDVTGNRRIIAVMVKAIDHIAFNDVDKTALFCELNRMYLNGFNWQISSKEMKELLETSAEFESHSIEQELVNRYYSSGNEWLTATEIKVEIEQQHNQRLNLKKVGQALKWAGMIRKSIKRNGMPIICYGVKR